MAGIDTELRMREMAAGGNPQAAQQRYAQSKSLMDLLVAQKVSNDYASARNAMQAATQAPAGTVRDQLDMSNAQVTKNDMMRSVMPGVQMKAARDSQAMQRQAMGIPTQPAPNIRMRDGGIVGFQSRGYVDADELSLEAAGIDPDFYASTFREDAGEGAQPSSSVVQVPGVGTVPIPSARVRELGRSPRETVGKSIEEIFLGSKFGEAFVSPKERAERLERLEEERKTRTQAPTPPASTDTGVTKEQFDAFTGMARPKDEQKFITDPTAKDVLRQLQTGPVRPQDRKEPEKKKGIFDNVDIGRLQAFLAGGAGQTSTAGALGGGLRGLMGEDQRREALASKEAIEAAKIASQRYGVERDYDAAMAKLGADNRQMLFEAQQTAIENYAKDDRKLAESMLDNLVTGRDEIFNRKMQDLQIEYGNNPDLLAAEMRAATNIRLGELMDAVRRTQGEVGAFDTDISETGAE